MINAVAKVNSSLALVFLNLLILNYCNIHALIIDHILFIRQVPRLVFLDLLFVHRVCSYIAILFEQKIRLKHRLVQLK